MILNQFIIIDLLHYLLYNHEKLLERNIYDILILNYNMNPVKKNKGSAIFARFKE